MSTTEEIAKRVAALSPELQRYILEFVISVSERKAHEQDEWTKAAAHAAAQAWPKDDFSDWPNFTSSSTKKHLD